LLWEISLQIKKLEPQSQHIFLFIYLFAYLISNVDRKMSRDKEATPVICFNDSLPSMLEIHLWYASWFEHEFV